MLNFDHDHMPWSLKTGLISLGKLLTEESKYSGWYSSTVTVAAQTAPCGKYVFAQTPHQSSFLPRWSVNFYPSKYRRRGAANSTDTK